MRDWGAPCAIQSRPRSWQYEPDPTWGLAVAPTYKLSILDQSIAAVGRPQVVVAIFAQKRIVSGVAEQVVPVLAADERVVVRAAE